FRSCCSTPSNVFTPTMYGSPRSSKKSIGANESASLRVSASTTAPIAPRTRSSHMNQKRSCPGVPNRYRIRSSSRETRPKSIATVVVDLFGVAARSSMPVLASVIIASVVNGTISETEPTNVVLPAPKPPATTILAEVIVFGAAWRGALKPTESTQHPFHQHKMRFGVLAARCGPVHGHQARVRRIADQHSRHSERHSEHRSDLGHRTWSTAFFHDDLLLDLVGDRQHRCITGGDQRFEFQRIVGFRPAAGDGVRTDETGFLSRDRWLRHRFDGDSFGRHELLLSGR